MTSPIIFLPVRSIIIVIAVLLASQNIFAMGLEVKKTSLPLWEVGLGAGVISLPDYRGSNETRELLLPILNGVYRGDKLRIDRRGIRGLIYESGNTAINISGDFGLPVNSDKNTARSGMPDLKFSFHLGPSFEYLINDDKLADSIMVFKFPVQLVLATDLPKLNSEGFFIYPHINYIKNGNWRLGVAAGAAFASKAFHDYYYSVAPQFAINGSRPAYAASGGFSGIRVSLALSKRYKKYWIGVFARYENLNNVSFDDSPLFKQNHSLMIGAGISWIFATSSIYTK